MQGHPISNPLTTMKGEEVSSEAVLPATPKSEDDTIADVKTENDIKEDESEEVNVDDILEGNNETAASSPDRKPSLDEGGSTLHLVRPKPVLPVAPAPPGEDSAISPCHKPPTTFSPGRSSRSGSTSGNGSPSVSGGASLGLGSPQSQPNVGSPLSSPQTNLQPHQAPVSSSPQLFQPFLPAAALAARAAAAISEGGGSTLPNLGSPLGSNHGVRPLPFSIDNILKPTFSGKEDGMMGAFPSPGNARFPFPAAAAFLGTAFPGLLLQHQHQSLLAALAGGGAAPGGLAPTKENSLSLPPPPHNLMTSSPSSSSMTSLSPPADRFASPSAVQPVSKTLGPKPVTTTSPKFVTKVKQEPPPPARSPEKGTLPKEAIDKLHKKEGKSTSEPVDLSKTSNTNNNNNGEEDGDVPPGMVRGPNGQLWPAWVFCTRYSDRPSSGEFTRKLFVQSRSLVH